MRKILRLAIPLCMMGGQSFCTPVLANPPAPSSPVLLSAADYRIGVGLAGEYMNSDTRLKIIPVNERELGKMGLAQSQVAKRLQVAFCGELGATMTHHYYLGLLVSWHHSGTHNMSNGPIKGGARFFSHEFNVNHYTDVMIKPAYKLTPSFMLYGLVGPSIANWQHTTTLLDRANNELDKVIIKKTSLGVALGLGFEYIFKKQYALSVDYTYHFFHSASKNQIISYLDTTAPPQLRTGDLVKKVQPSFGTIAVRFSMFFQL